jgi:hypothetical protein
MLVKRRLTSNPIATKLLLVMFLVFLTTAGNCDPGCNTQGELRAAHPHNADKFQFPTILICPGDEAVLLWSMKNAQQATIEPGIGRVDDNGTKTQGAVTVKPRETTHFTLKVNGDCSKEYPVTVQVLNDGDDYLVSMVNLNKSEYLWQGLIQYASPSILISRVRLGDVTAAAWQSWSFEKDQTGTISLAGTDRVDVPESTLNGSYRLYPSGSCDNCVNTGNNADVLLTVKCRMQ